nr:hypothetical protein [Tanacetum cinerariifolium]
MTTHIWHIISHKESLWVRWIHTYKLRGRTFWDICPSNAMSWGWRKLLQLRDIVKPYFWKQVGNGLNTSLLFDRWCLQGPLIRFLSPRDIAREGYTLETNVADLIINGDWNWPFSWLAKAPTISSIAVPLLRDQIDKDAGSSKSNISNVKDKVDTIRKPSFASVVHEKPQKTIIKIKEMRNEVSVNGAIVTIPMEAVESVNARFVNTSYGYFIGDREGMEIVLENGPWLICRMPLLLNE